jgi:hypothetical protein
MEQEYIITVFSENKVGLLSQITKPSPQSTITTKDQIETIAGIWIG